MYYSIHLNLVLFLYVRIQESTAQVSYMYPFTTENMWLTMPDGVRLSATLNIPIEKNNDEKFPVLLEYKPYRKDDSFYNFEQPNIYYLARRGFFVSKKETRIIDVCVLLLPGSHS